MTWPPPSCPCQGTQYAISSVWRGGPRGARTTWSAMKPQPVTSPHVPLGCCLGSICCSWPLPVEWLSLGGSSCLLSWSGPAFWLPQSCAFRSPQSCACHLPRSCAFRSAQTCAFCLPQNCAFHSDQGFAFNFLLSRWLQSTCPSPVPFKMTRNLPSVLAHQAVLHHLPFAYAFHIDHPLAV